MLLSQFRNCTAARIQGMQPSSSELFSGQQEPSFMEYQYRDSTYSTYTNFVRTYGQKYDL